MILVSCEGLESEEIVSKICAFPEHDPNIVWTTNLLNFRFGLWHKDKDCQKDF